MWRAVVAVTLVALFAARAEAYDLPRFGGMHQTGGGPLPMLDSKIDLVVRGPIVEVLVTQRFHNRGDQATEATYIFPLPPDAAVSAMWIKTGTKTIRAQVARREDAQQRYEAAVRAGVTASVLDQERPDIFTQTVAGIAPRSTVEVTLRYDALAHFYDGAWAFAIPLVVAPRYVAGVATSRPTTGTGRAPDTDRAPDASRVTPGGAPGAGGPTTVSVQFADKAWDITSPTHELAVSGTKATFTDPRSDHDAILRWKAPTAAGWVEQGGFAAVVVEAPAAPLQRKAGLRCLLVLDRSASARGDADALAQPLVRQFLGNLDPNDRVAVHGSDTLAWSPPSAVQRALDQSWTQKTGAFDLTRTLATARPDGAPIILVTGALVADDRAAVAAAKKLGVPVHVIGVGPAPARGLLLQIATATGGTARFATPGDDLPTLARSVIADAANPAAPLTVNWGTLAASEVVPGTLPRLGAGQAVLVLARVAKAQTANARANNELFAIEMLPAPRAVEGVTSSVGPLGRRWARSRLEEMLATNVDAKRVTAHALQFGLVSPYTSMVAIGDEVVVQGGTRRSVAVPVSVPAGMKWQQVKKETTVELSKRKEPVTRDYARNIPAPTRSPISTTTTTKAPVKPTDARKPVPAGPAEPEDKPTKQARDAGDDEEAEDDNLDASSPAPQIDVATSGAAGESMTEIGQPTSIRSSIGLGNRLRLTTSFGAGLARSRGESASLVTLGARLEYGRVNLVGFDTSLSFLEGEAQGRVMIGVARRGIARWLELGAAVGGQLGNGTGAAGSLSLRIHLPPVPRAATFLRYDAAYLTQDDVRRGEHALTLGVEWGF